MLQNIRELKGVGEKTEKLLGKLGITSIQDLLEYYPRDYDQYLPVRDIKDAPYDKLISIRGTIVSGVGLSTVRGKTIITASVSDGTDKISLIWYNMPFLRNTLKKGGVYIFRGKIHKRNNRVQMEHPEMYALDAYEKLLNTLQPKYMLTAGVSNKMITKLVRQVLDENIVSVDYLPVEIRERFGLADRNYAIETVHFPSRLEDLVLARKRLVFEEFFQFILGMQMMKGKMLEADNAFPMKRTWVTESLIEELPYRLTRSQERVWHEIERDLQGSGLMSRLVQGDVGSGKTILAFLGMVMCAENGYQAAMMAPTEVLAKQHYDAFVKLKEQYQLTNCYPVLLTGSTTAKERRTIYQQMEQGTANIIIGTHALIQEKVKYHKLALVITDEQHRFGVRQREALSTKGELPNVLVMSATPIPRTLAMILYGDLDISVLNELPSNRIPIKNCVVGTDYRDTAYRFMQRQIEEGRQVYVICPMVEESEGLDGENVKDYTEKLKNVFPPEIHVKMLHGKMKPKEKNQIMEEFASGEIQVLVSTTVVEVGVDVPNATVMMIENSERFGLAQLHQLRGRVGRGSHQSYCIFMQGNNDEEVSARLKILNKSNDGFYIAEQDLKLRGPGDLLGVRQSGEMEFHLGDIFQDAEILRLASEAAGEVLCLDPMLMLPQNKLLAQHMKIYMETKISNASL